MGSSFLGMFAQAFATFLNIYFVLLIIRILLSWFPNVDWMSQPFATLSQLTDPYLNLFRSIIPPLGGIDFSPILAFFSAPGGVSRGQPGRRHHGLFRVLAPALDIENGVIQVDDDWSGTITWPDILLFLLLDRVL